MKRSSVKEVVLLFVSCVVGVIILEAGLRSYYYYRHGPFRFATIHALAQLIEILRLPAVSGVDLNRQAWESSYTERGLKVPPTGPREGYWGSRIAPKNVDAGLLGTSERAQNIPGLVEIDSGGFQHVGNAKLPSPHILIIGASVAFGAYASTIDSTYFVKLLRRIQTDYPDTKISVYGVGASTSDNDLAVLVLKGLDLRPDIVVFLNGLNDLAIAGEKDLNARLREYLRNMAMAQYVGNVNHVRVVFALQPFLGGKRHKTVLERRIMALSGTDYENLYMPYVQRMREGLQTSVRNQPLSTFVDCSGIFDEEEVTTFADQWHFSDPGHAILADTLSAALLPLLRQWKQARESTQVAN